MDNGRIFNRQQLDDLLVALSLQLCDIINDVNRCEDRDHLNEFLIIIVGDLTRLDRIDFSKLLNVQDYF